MRASRRLLAPRLMLHYKRYFFTRNGSEQLLWECFAFDFQSFSIVGTVMKHTKLPVTLLFLTMHLMTQHNNAISASPLKRQLSFFYRSAWLLQYKLIRMPSTPSATWRNFAIASIAGYLAVMLPRLLRTLVSTRPPPLNRLRASAIYV